MPKPSNIVLIMADQLAPQFTGAYGHDIVQTPHMDALAESGTRFDAAYCNSPLCAPSRFSFMAGKHVSNIAAYDNAAEFPASIPTFAHYLRAMGYRTCLSGKMHFVGPDQLHGFDERLTTDVYPADFAWTPDWENAGERIDKWYHNMDSVFEAGPAATSFQIEFDEEATFLARRKIFDYAMRKTEPFAMVVSLMHPHDPYVPRPEFWNLYGDNQIDMPMTGPADDPGTQRLMRGIEADGAPVSAQDIRNARRGYYANTTYFDSKVGEIVKALKEADLYDDTIIIVTSDHGDMLGERGLWYKMCFYEHSARVPLIMSGPGVERQSVAEPVSLVDILPTFLDIAENGGADRPELGMDLDGNSLWPLASGADDPDRVVYGEYCAECTGAPILMIREGAYKYIHCDGDPPQLYNVDDDPFERTNLANDPDFADLAAEYAGKLADRWDSAALRAEVVANQRRRRAVHAGMSAGQRVDWDYNPPRNASEEYVRNHQDWTVAAATKRYPPLEGAKIRS